MRAKKEGLGTRLVMPPGIINFITNIVDVQFGCFSHAFVSHVGHVSHVGQLRYSIDFWSLSKK